MRARVSLSALLFSLATLQAIAEVSSTASSDGYAVVMMSPANAPSTEIWSEVRSIPPELLLNPLGVARGDHSPKIAINPQTLLPEAVWCYWDGADTEIAWSRFDGNMWAPPEIITSNSVADSAPSLGFDSDGATAVAWESHGPTVRIDYRERSVNATWSPLIHVSEETGDAGSPTVGSQQGSIRVGYVQPRTGSSRAVMVALGVSESQPWPGYFTPELIAMISFSGDIAPELHSYPDQLFTTWVNSSNEIGFARFDGTTWQTPQTETYTSAEDLPKARIRAKSRALHSP